MKKCAILAAILAALIAVGACDTNGSKKMSTRTTVEKIMIGHLEIVTQGTTYIPIEHWVHSLENGVAADGKHFDKIALEMYPDLNAKLEAATPIPYAEDFRFYSAWPGDSEKTEINVKGFGHAISFTIFDEQMNRITSSSLMENPPGPGLYYVAAEIEWGSSTKNACYQYIFKLKVN